MEDIPPALRQQHVYNQGAGAKKNICSNIYDYSCYVHPLGSPAWPTPPGLLACHIMYMYVCKNICDEPTVNYNYVSCMSGSVCIHILTDCFGYMCKCTSKSVTQIHDATCICTCNITVCGYLHYKIFTDVLFPHNCTHPSLPTTTHLKPSLHVPPLHMDTCSTAHSKLNSTCISVHVCTVMKDQSQHKGQGDCVTITLKYLESQHNLHLSTTAKTGCANCASANYMTVHVHAQCSQCILGHRGWEWTSYMSMYE